MFFGQLFVPEAVVTEHQVVMRLQVFGIDFEHALQRLYSLVVFALQEEDAAQIVQRDAIAWSAKAKSGRAARPKWGSTSPRSCIESFEPA